MIIINCLRSLCKKKYKSQASELEYQPHFNEFQENNFQFGYIENSEDYNQWICGQGQDYITQDYITQDFRSHNFSGRHIQQQILSNYIEPNENEGNSIEIITIEVLVKNKDNRKKFDAVNARKYNSSYHTEGNKRIKKNECFPSNQNYKPENDKSDFCYKLNQKNSNNSLSFIESQESENESLSYMNKSLPISLSINIKNLQGLKKNNTPRYDVKEIDMEKINKDNQDDIPNSDASTRDSNHSQNDKILVKTQEEILRLREKGLLMLDNVIDKTQACIFCQIPINENDISFSLPCKHRSCYICIYNKLQDIIGGEKSQLLLCICDAVIYIYLFAKEIEIESLNLYAETISKIPEINPNIKSYCPYDLHLNEKYIPSVNNTCEKCRNNFCRKCGLAHLTQTCLEFYNETFKEEIKEKIPKCTECDKDPFEVELGCECQLCLKCCKVIVNDFLLKENPMNDPVCIKHKVIIPRMYIYQAFGGQHFFILEQEKAIDLIVLSAKFICEICLLELRVSQSITLECDHRFCSECIKLYLNTTMKEYYFANKVGCPKCNDLISYEILRNNSDPEIFKRYLNFTVMAFQPENKLEVMKWCTKCNFGFIIPKNKPKTKCPNCKEFKKCEKSESKPKSEDFRSTQSSLENKLILNDNEKFLKNFNQDYVECPNCGEAIQKVAGCNFLVCSWPRCTGVCFCAICRKVLNKSQHYSHYKVSGPFGATCNTLDKLKDE